MIQSNLRQQIIILCIFYNYDILIILFIYLVMDPHYIFQRIHVTKRFMENNSLFHPYNNWKHKLMSFLTRSFQTNTKNMNYIFTRSRRVNEPNCVSSRQSIWIIIATIIFLDEVVRFSFLFIIWKKRRKTRRREIRNEKRETRWTGPIVSKKLVYSYTVLWSHYFPRSYFYFHLISRIFFLFLFLF